MVLNHCNIVLCSMRQDFRATQPGKSREFTHELYHLRISNILGEILSILSALSSTRPRA